MFIGDIRVSFFDLWPCRRLGTQRQHGINYISDNKVVHQHTAMDKNLNTDCTEDTDLALSQIFLVSKWYWIYFQIFVDSRVLGHSLFLKSIR